MSIVDADGHVTETQEQVARYLDEPYRRRPARFPFYPWDGWDRRMLGTLGDWAGDAEAWLRALDKGGMEAAVLYETAERLGVMLAVHASSSHLGGGGVELFPRFIQAHTCSHPFGQMRQLTSLVLEGVPERFPRLRLAFLEAGCGWVPYWMERMDDEYARRAAEAPALRRRPSEYVRGGTLYFACEADEWLLPQAVRLVGERQIVYASDFPHWDHSYPASLEEVRARGDLTGAQKRLILGDNARRLYGLGGAA